MNTLQNIYGDCLVFKATKRWVPRCLSHVLFGVLLSSVIALMCCNTALALDINQANEAELDSVKGMGPALSAKVLKARAQGPFKDWQDLMQRVSGIRQNKAKQFSEQGLTVDGQAFATKP
jgi:competence protein ComEA